MGRSTGARQISHRMTDHSARWLRAVAAPPSAERTSRSWMHSWNRARQIVLRSGDRLDRKVVPAAADHGRRGGGIHGIAPSGPSRLLATPAGIFWHRRPSTGLDRADERRRHHVRASCKSETPRHRAARPTDRASSQSALQIKRHSQIQSKMADGVLVGSYTPAWARAAPYGNQVLLTIRLEPARDAAYQRGMGE